MAYTLSVVDDLLVGEVEDIVVQNQDRWFLDVALKHNIWFPPNSILRGLKPAKYVAYYRTGDNDLPSHLSHLARIRKVWWSIRFDDVCSLPEFSSLFARTELAEVVATFKNKEDFFHIAQTDTPVRLAKPIPLGNPRTALVLTMKRFPLTRLLAARTTDDLFAPKDNEG